ncbi:hypothetical protein B6V75_10055 [Thioclava sp. F1Mire-8]|uniref:hypothetical protein n=1 Tax=Thioclava sp. F1Mire-8 TaxID=1973006 RepID=UPI000B53E109|nr:hypothetical protein [Thioclava sp. F1Mire-8]OWY03754.1 hypothetical protein B6V75_10055 [Thioclava sp. F1Mire-8]
MDQATLTSLVGSLLSLFGILISLFSVHLGNWLAKLQAIRAKWQTNRGSSAEAKAAKRECRYDFAEIYNWQPFVMTVILLGFAAAVLWFFYDVQSSEAITFPSIFDYVFYGFFAVLIALSLFLLCSGYNVGEYLRKEIEKEFPAPAKSS